MSAQDIAVIFTSLLVDFIDSMKPYIGDFLVGTAKTMITSKSKYDITMKYSKIFMECEQSVIKRDLDAIIAHIRSQDSIIAGCVDKIIAAMDLMEDEERKEHLNNLYKWMDQFIAGSRKFLSLV